MDYNFDDFNGYSVNELLALFHYGCEISMGELCFSDEDRGEGEKLMKAVEAEFEKRLNK